ncbi:hypothetical protein D9741_21515 [Escherichia sp. E14V7]|nr:hypothetical protein D9740_00065 [Escherichia sp. E14V5]RZN00219.1 hypothetical protein D9741_21515 [Escherichia sp. E14V7]RZN24244.1 hypothetical protein D9739_20870 [Escherichia sp. E14V10]TGB59182.1 hypothetical protein CRT22_06275 [Escherichia sp. E5028]
MHSTQFNFIFLSRPTNKVLTKFGCNTAYGTCVISGLETLKGTIHSLLGQTNQVAGMCKSMMMLTRRLTSVAIRFDAWEETRVQR